MPQDLNISVEDWKEMAIPKNEKGGYDSCQMYDEDFLHLYETHNGNFDSIKGWIWFRY